MWTREKALALFREVGIVPVIRVESSEEALRAVEGIVGGGIATVELTMTIPHALRVVESVTQRYGDQVLVGAGTVLDPETCRAALLAGAEFIVGPGLDLRVVEMTRRYGKVAVPGALTPTEVLAAWQGGADLVKIFHSGLAGGPKYIRALKGPFPNIEFLATGGIGIETALEYIRAGATAVGIGESILDMRALRQGNIETIAASARKCLEAVRLARIQLASFQALVNQ